MRCAALLSSEMSGRAVGDPSVIDAEIGRLENGVIPCCLGDFLFGRDTSSASN
jgi:hypothetical protein